MLSTQQQGVEPRLAARRSHPSIFRVGRTPVPSHPLNVACKGGGGTLSLSRARSRFGLPPLAWPSLQEPCSVHHTGIFPPYLLKCTQRISGPNRVSILGASSMQI
ncbi:hypothetical protein PUNSTDRAFT_50614 [Punctularia strigosozonata HHB-11173 SS5]|uniref:uncharacterized protein n=1 Tax=Punctularia strigosozonata (strain HHB-11173) TaxID=741275 RepID=UPI00044182CB|nr:uncharacterized protein PUNSTDRAFT_50614 [Punctularia strigosozonata HHB-11173 SS5]EIN11731.1 hypothetical protein PUNSTDRAFT_50614 [Punctularia strigosozonata HHB-11173 SS5]